MLVLLCCADDGDCNVVAPATTAPLPQDCCDFGDADFVYDLLVVVWAFATVLLSVVIFVWPVVFVVIVVVGPG